MRPAILTMFAATAVLCGIASAAMADVKILVKTRTYDIAGKTGAELIAAMNRTGPRHGFTTRAVAETGYTIHWDLDIARADGVCRLRQANGTMNLTYTFPRLAPGSGPTLARRWNRFLAGVRTHERTHGRIARQMMQATGKALAGLEQDDNFLCLATHREARRRIREIYDRYEARQVAFDAREHRDGGHVDHLIAGLAGGATSASVK